MDERESPDRHGRLARQRITAERLFDVDMRIADLARDTQRRFLLSVLIEVSVSAIFVATVMGVTSLRTALFGEGFALSSAVVAMPPLAVFAVALSVLLTMLHLILRSFAQKRQAKAELLLIKSDLLAARLASADLQAS